MMQLMIGGCLGLLLGITIQACGFSRREGLDGAVAFRHGAGVRTLLYTIGLGMMLTSVLCWLAVIDVDLLRIHPLHSGVLIGGALCGLAIGISGRTPVTMLCALGGERVLEALCGIAGCVAGAWLAPLLPVDGLQTLFTPVEGTLFRLTLNDPWLLSGGTLAFLCLGVLLCCTALFVPMRLVSPALLDRRRLPAPTEKAPAEEIIEAEMQAESTEQSTETEDGATDEVDAPDEPAAAVPDESPEQSAPETSHPKRKKRRKRKKHAQIEPVMHDHPELETPPSEKDDAVLIPEEAEALLHDDDE